jgi:hypothetical protein
MDYSNVNLASFILLLFSMWLLLLNSIHRCKGSHSFCTKPMIMAEASFIIDYFVPNFCIHRPRWMQAFVYALSASPDGVWRGFGYRGGGGRGAMEHGGWREMSPEERQAAGNRVLCQRHIAAGLVATFMERRRYLVRKMYLYAETQPTFMERRLCGFVIQIVLFPLGWFLFLYREGGSLEQ